MPDPIVSSAVSATSHPNFGLVISGVLAFFTACVVALLRWSGSRGTAAVELQKVVDDRIRILMDRLEADRALSAARASELAQENELLRDRIGDLQRDRLELTGDIANLKQAQESALRLQEKQGRSPIPPSSALRHKPEGEPDD